MNNQILINSQNHLHLVDQKDIVFCQSDNCYTYINLLNGAPLTVSKPLSKFFINLNTENFIRVHQSFVINRSFIKSVDKRNKHIIMINDTQIQFSITLKELINLLDK